MKKLFIIATIITVTSATSVFAKAEKDTALLDVNKITTESKAAKSLNNQMQSIREKIQSEIDRREAELRKKEEELGKSKDKLTPAQFQKKQSEFSEEVRNLQEWVMGKNQELQQEMQRVMQTLRDEVENVTQDYAKAQGYDFIMPKQVPIYSSDKIADVTDEIIAKLDKKLPDLKLNVKAA